MKGIICMLIIAGKIYNFAKFILQVINASNVSQTIIFFLIQFVTKLMNSVQKWNNQQVGDKEGRLGFERRGVR